MPHQCVKCSTFFEDGAEEILKGCPCGGRLFFFIRKEKFEELKKSQELKLSDEDKKKIESDVFDILDVSHSEPIILDFESIRIAKPGTYELDLVNLFKGDPVVFKLDEGKYIIDVPSTFNQQLKKDKAKK